jgi:O-antigen ligase
MNLPRSALGWTCAAGATALCAAFVWSAPDLFLPSLAVPLASVVAGLAIAYPAVATPLWLAVIATCPEMWLGDLLGGGPLIIGLDKAAGLLLAMICVARFGLRRDLANPGFAFMAMAVAGMLHGLLPTLSLSDSLRSVIGSAAPFAFSFARLSLTWSRRVIGIVILAPYLIVGLGLGLAALGLRPVYGLEDGSLRLGGSTHPAFLAGFALISLYALLLELLRQARPVSILLLGGDLVILLGTGARAPLALAVALILVTAVLLPSVGWTRRSRLGMLLGLAALPPLAAFLAPSLGFLRVLALAGQGEETDLSNRTLIWPTYEAAFHTSPWFGWGVGAGKVLLPVTSPLAALLGTNAAHDEYLRIAVEGGAVGLGLLVLLVALWLRQGTRPMPGGQRAYMACVFLVFAAHSATDNTLIATTASLMFAWVSAVFARAEAEAGGLIIVGAPPMIQR